MINIQLDEDYTIQSDEHSFILSKRYGKRYVHTAFFSDLQVLLQHYVQLCVRSSDVKTIQELINYQNSLLASLSKSLQPLHFEIEVRKVQE